jgi:HD-GYP domain-containing protein (c-di-GMP phosphodiesterase class II)
MFARAVSSNVKLGRVGEHAMILEQEVFPLLRRNGDFRGLIVFLSGTEALSISLWGEMESAKANSASAFREMGALVKEVVGIPMVQVFSISDSTFQTVEQILNQGEHVWMPPELKMYQISDLAFQRVCRTVRAGSWFPPSAPLDLSGSEMVGHSRRATRYCLEMAQAIGQPTDQLKHIERGAYLHDIGKIGIPDAILLKPDKLTEGETAVMQTHVRIGYDLVSRISFLAPAAAIVLTHQERYDGTGYPQGLRGEEIPVGARIFAVADTLDAMTSNRPYRRALPFEAARAEIRHESGRQFDPEVVQVFVSVSDLTWEKIRLEVSAPQRRMKELQRV